MKSSVIPYFIQFALHLAVLLSGAFIAKLAMNQINYEEDDLIATGLAIILGLSVYIITTYVILMSCTKGMRMFTIRIKNILTHKI
jgi:hypothetical protein